MKQKISLLLTFFVLLFSFNSGAVVHAVTSDSTSTTSTSSSSSAPAEITLSLGKNFTLKEATKQLDLTQSDGGTIDSTKVTYTSNKPTVLTVTQKGLVTVKSVGAATITASYEGRQASVTIKIDQLPLTSLTIKQSTLTLLLGKQEKLTVSSKPVYSASQLAVKWQSQNPKIASVDSRGTVTAIKAGKTTITASFNGKTAKSTVTVKEVPLKSIKLNKSQLKLATGGTETLSVTYQPTNTTVRKAVKWTSSNSRIASIDGKGKITAKKTGKVTITATVAGKKATATVNIHAQQPSHVYITKTGKRYHYKSNCRGLNNSKSTQRVTLKDAQKKKFTLCQFEK